MVTNQVQELILGGFGDLLATRGGPRFLRTPQVEPNEAFFPDGWTADQGGVHRLLRRIMFHAGLGDVPLAVDRFVFEADEEPGEPERGRHVVAYFEGVTDRVCRFGVNCTQLDDPEHLIGILAHEVAHAYRHIHGLVVEDSDEEEDLTDLTTVFLGFGILTTNNARQSTIGGGMLRVRGAGYLSPHAMAFALASWFQARGIAADRELAERWLEPLQASMFAKVLAQIPASRVRDRLDLSGTLLVPKPLPARLDDAPPAPPDAEPVDFAAKRSDTFRVLIRRRMLTTPLGALGGALLTMTQVAPSIVSLLLGGVVGGACGLALGRSMSRDQCAIRDCEAKIPPKAARCPRCGSVVQGALDDGASLEDALEGLRKKRVAERRARRGEAA
ncbi:MAG TPA: hypothetical protein VLT33_40300 [Labilithrix sp.]|nr:hypothetical protein [Labilithrix sp.]